LVRRYPASEQAREGQVIYERLQALQHGLTKIDAARKAGGPRPVSLNIAEETALQALEFEQAKQLDRAKDQWSKLVVIGKQNVSLTLGGKPAMEDPSVRPWILLAEEKLRAPNQ
jgi:hypothetical protein